MFFAFSLSLKYAYTHSRWMSPIPSSSKTAFGASYNGSLERRNLRWSAFFFKNAKYVRFCGEILEFSFKLKEVNQGFQEFLSIVNERCTMNTRECRIYSRNFFLIETSIYRCKCIILKIKNRNRK